MGGGGRRGNHGMNSPQICRVSATDARNGKRVLRDNYQYYRVYGYGLRRFKNNLRFRLVGFRNQTSWKMERKS